jgi:hypothetical protein
MSPDSPPDFRRQQLAFTAHIRDPAANPAPEGIPPRRMGIYTELLFNNINDQLSGNFPILRGICSDAYWHDLVRDFMRRHTCTTPLFTEVGQEFLAYLQDEREARHDDWPFMLELAHYEYVELAVAIRPDDGPLPGLDPNGDLLRGVPVIAPTAWSLAYVWPVHRIGSAYLPSEPPAEPTHLVVYRDRLDDVRFLQINAVTQRLLQLAGEQPAWPGLHLLQAIAAELNHPSPDAVIDGGRAMLEELRQRNVILGAAT